jgi:hypothetical protein
MMAKPIMDIPQNYARTRIGRRYYGEGWSDGISGKERRYSDFQTCLDLTEQKGQTALRAYEDGYKAGQAAAPAS